jgi:hypothetical protein
MRMMLLDSESDRVSEAFTRFSYGISSEVTRKKYSRELQLFLDHTRFGGSTLEQKAQNFYDLCVKTDSNKITGMLIKYLLFQINRAKNGDIAKSTIRNYYKPLKLFCEMNNIILNWKIISKGIPKAMDACNDRIPTMEEIQKLIEYPDRRIKPIVYTMLSSGIRVGAWEWLRWRDVIPVERDGKIVASKLLVYSGEPEQYFSFITSEAYFALKEWMDFRASHGEKVTKDSWLMRDLWDSGLILKDPVNDGNLRRGTYGVSSVSHKITSDAIRQIFNRAWRVQNIRKAESLTENHKTYSFKATHAFRKYFETKCLKKMKLLNVKLLMGHDTGLEKSYYKPSESELLQDYLQAVDDLTINEEFRLKMKISDLEARQDEIDLLRLKYEQDKTEMDQKLDKIMSIIRENPKLANVKVNSLKKKMN